MSATDLASLASDGPAVCRLSVDHEMLLAIMRRLTQDQDRELQIDRCLALGASVQMMGDFFGLTGNDCSTRRSLLGLETRQGRLAMPAEEDEHDAWHRWQQIAQEPQDPQRAPEDIRGMMVLAEETGIPLAVVWHLVKAWTSPDEPLSEFPRDEPEGDASEESHLAGGRVWAAM